MPQPKYVLRFEFEWRVEEVLWPSNNAARQDLNDVGPLAEEDLPQLSAETWQQMRALTEWHDTSLNWSYPPDPGPWRQEECDRFNQATEALFERIRAELGADFEVINLHKPIQEDPALDAYLADPKGFRRRT